MGKKSIIIGVIIMLCLSVIWIWTIAIPKKSIMIGGSTSVNSFMQRFTTKYQKEEKKDFIYNSTGSQSGITSVKQGMYEIGFISKDLDPEMIEQNDWANIENNFDINSSSSNENAISILNKVSNNTNKYYALEFALDAIIIIYNPPIWWMQQKLDNYMDFYTHDFKNSKNYLEKVYNDELTWEELAKEISIKTNKIFNIPDSKSKFKPYTREPGSGTRTAFSELTNIDDMSKIDAKNSNGTMFTSVQNTVGSIGFVSYAYLKNVTPNNNVKIAGINHIKLGNFIDEPNEIPNTHNLTILTRDDMNIFKTTTIKNDKAIAGIDKENEYKFKRPYIAIFKGDTKHIPEIINFFKLLIDLKKNRWVEECYNQEGLIAEAKFITPLSYEIKPKRIL